MSGFQARGASVVKKSRPPDLLRGPIGSCVFFVLNSVVSFVVILLRFPVDLRGPSHNTDGPEHRVVATLCRDSPDYSSDGVQGVAGSNPAVPTG